MPVHVNFLHRFALLRDLPATTLEHLAANMTLQSLSRREVALSRTEVGQGLGFLLEGRLQGVDFTVDGREVGLYFVEQGDYFGELSVVDGQAGAEFVIAVAKSQVLFLPRDIARSFIFASPTVAEQMMLRLAQRVRAVTAQRILLSLPNPFQRLCAQLLQLSGEGQQTEISHLPTQQELAIMINTSRETVTRSFQLLQTKQVVSREGNRLTVHDVRFLREIAEGKIDPPKN